MFAYSGWGDDPLVKAGCNLKETLVDFNDTHDQFLTSEAISNSISNFMLNAMDDGDYKRPEKAWHEWARGLD